MAKRGSSPYNNISEPLPIPVDPSIDDRARQFLRAVTLGRIDRTRLNERLNAILPDGVDAAAEYVTALGTAEDMYAFEQRITAEGLATYYRVRYPSGLWTWIYSEDRAGGINGFALRRSPGHKIFDIWLRDVAY